MSPPNARSARPDLVPTRTTLHYADNPEPTDHLTAAVERGHISVRAARRMGWTR